MPLLFYSFIIYNNDMVEELSIKYIDNTNYSIGIFKNGVLNGWGAKYYFVDGIETIERGFYKDGRLDGVGIIYRFLEDGPSTMAGIFKDGEYYPPEKVKSTISGQEYSFMPNYNGDKEYRDVIYHGYLAEDGYPRGFGMVDDNGTYYYLHCDEEGYRTGLFIFSNPDGSYGEFLYSIDRTELDKREWAMLMMIGVGVNVKKLLKKLPHIN